MNPRPWFWLIFHRNWWKELLYLGKGEVGESQWISTAEVKSLRVFIFILGAGGEVVGNERVGGKI